MALNNETNTTGRLFIIHKHKVIGVMVKQFAQVLSLGLVLDNFYRQPKSVLRLIKTKGLQYVGINPIMPPLWRLYGNQNKQTQYRLLDPIIQKNLQKVSSQSTFIDIEVKKGLKDYPINVPLYTKPLLRQSHQFIFNNVQQFLNNEVSDLDYVYKNGFWYVGSFQNDTSIPNGYFIKKQRLSSAIRNAFRRNLNNETQI